MHEERKQRDAMASQESWWRVLGKGLTNWRRILRVSKKFAKGMVKVGTLVKGLYDLAQWVATTFK